MDSLSSIIEKDGKILCNKHNQDILMISMDKGMTLSDRLLCVMCFSQKQTISTNLISMDQAKKMISDNLSQTQQQTDSEKQQSVNSIQSFLSFILELKTKMIQRYDEVVRICGMWMQNLNQINQSSQNYSLINELEKITNQTTINNEAIIAEIQKCNYSFCQKIELSFAQLTNQSEHVLAQGLLKTIAKGSQKQKEPEQTQKIEQQQKIESQIKEPEQIEVKKPKGISQSQPILTKQDDGPISFQQVDAVNQDEPAIAIAFNLDGSLMAAGCGKDIKIWEVDDDQLVAPTVLQGHQNSVWTIAFSKEMNWFTSGSSDFTIRGWKGCGNGEWKSSHPQMVHTGSVTQLLLNKSETQLISCGEDKKVNIWTVNRQQNELIHDYTLNQHTGAILGMSLNESETQLITTGADNQILVWFKDQKQKWNFRYPVTKNINDKGLGICFINDSQFLWLQASQGYLHVFEMVNKKFNEKSQLKIFLHQEGVDNCQGFPIIYNPDRQLFIIKHQKFIFIIKKGKDGKFQVEADSINQNCDQHYGGLSVDGQYLALWSESDKKLKLLKTHQQ